MTVYEKIKQYCKENHMTIAGFERMCGFGNGAVNYWRTGICPSGTSLKRIALATGIPMAKWLEDEAA